MSLCDNLKAARARMGMSQELVAEWLGISRQAVTKWEAGQSKPSAQNLQALAELYGMSTEELLSDEQPKGPNLILRTNLTRIAIAAQAVFGHLCARTVYQLRYCNDTDRSLYLGMFLFALVLLMLASIWMASNHRYETNKDQRRKNTKIELVYCLIQAFICVYHQFWHGVAGSYFYNFCLRNLYPIHQSQIHEPKAHKVMSKRASNLRHVSTLFL